MLQLVTLLFPSAEYVDPSILHCCMHQLEFEVYCRSTACIAAVLRLHNSSKKAVRLN